MAGHVQGKLHQQFLISRRYELGRSTAAPWVTRPLTLSPSEDLGTPNSFAACLTVLRPDFTSISARSIDSSVHFFFFVLPILSKWFLDGMSQPSTEEDTSKLLDSAKQGITEEVLSDTTKEIVQDIKNTDTESPESVEDLDGTVKIAKEEKNLEEKIVIDTTAKESPETLLQVETSVTPEKEIVIETKANEESTVREHKETTDDETVVTETPKETAVQSESQTPALEEINPDQIFKAEPVVVESSPESPASEVEESSVLKSIATVQETSGETKTDAEVDSTSVVPSVASENQTTWDISDALDVVPNGDQSKEKEGKLEITDALDKSEELKNSSGEQPTDNNSLKNPVEKQQPSSKYIMRDGKEVCSHCDQFIGLIKLTLTYPPMYLHPDCLVCGSCAKVLGHLQTPMFEHKQRIYCSDCYDKNYSLY
ncbi:hypothetical protein WMY93_007889 [Mugilogobius chulae]|uniref:LIM zinc-binding domain-containing protein n=1 Tax=Mugilogobius chulae TaxID=88201 RepID=A0AAW0PED0_9GOBI